MNREIKFRAWDKKEKEILSHMDLFKLDTTNEEPFLPLLEKFKTRYELMQFTGLYDKSNSPIYEGDVLSTDLSRPYLVVEFRNGAFMFQCHHNGQDYYDFMTSDYEDSNFTKYHEVLGNIHEHPYLLGGVDK